MHDFSVSYKKLIQLTFIFSLFLSTGAVVDFLIAGPDVRDQLEESNSQLRLFLWLPVYLLFTFFSVIYYKKLLDFFKQNLPFLSLLLLCLVSCLWSGLFSLSIYSSSQMVLLTCFAIIVGYSFSAKSILKQIYFVLCTIIVLSFIYVLAMPEYGVSTYVDEVAFRGVFPEKNRLGQVLVYYFCLSFALFKRNTVNMAIFAMACFLMLGNKSATALVLTLMLPAFFYISKLFYGNQKSIMVNSFAAFILVFITTSILIFTYEYLLLLLGKDPTLTGRTDLWHYGIESVMENPFLGFGYNAFWKYEGGMGGEYIRILLEWGPMSMHNGWFETVLQLGIIGLLLALYVFFQLLGLSVSALNKSKMSQHSRVIFVFILIYFIWSLMQHIILRHQEFTHYLFTVIFSCLFFYKTKSKSQIIKK
ncbi:hypothetical protein Q4567_15810 [Aliiglaciecola sp. 2_MG-2023]|uniref:O-antigen ligase family protein n=1 Tax=unclassified Aliiglaciecola TaxID=2593648 RepID=UPI0026E3A121|nr:MULTISPECIES: O-antigen ligase family protein [unclassified Aliiglaciecola]MDO6712201.1 hypothetical protein [Aliiglaciecola sp. 2_MG-2023]MDO6753561.1 hypothetical protein [Aliiglaciecola sp. 1_MG-2023]